MNPAPPSGDVLYARASAHLRLRHLRLLAAMELKGTLGAAATETGISQPAATQMLRELENLLETRLVERHARGVAFTDAGKVLAAFARQTLDAMRGAAASLADVAAGRNTTLKIGAIQAAIIGILEPALARLIARYPNNRYDLAEIVGPGALIAGLHAGSFDVVLVREPDKPEPNLHFTPLFADELVIVAPPAHPAATVRRVSLSTLADYAWMLASPQLLTRTVFDAWCSKTGFTPKRSTISGNSTTLLPAALAAGNAIAPAPASIVHTLIKQGVLRQVRIDLQLPLPALGGLYRRDDTNRQIGRFLDALRGGEPPVQHSKAGRGAVRKA
ncbi:MAG TPA: LysR family transcriptional regulator [Noviherbaspirillum sp.]|nr:LysR family transcriptional regulator [Noviherbaspirillum sp.]